MLQTLFHASEVSFIDFSSSFSKDLFFLRLSCEGGGE